MSARTLATAEAVPRRHTEPPLVVRVDPVGLTRTRWLRRGEVWRVREVFPTGTRANTVWLASVVRDGDFFRVWRVNAAGAGFRGATRVGAPRKVA